MDTPQEPARSKIVPFRPRNTPDSASDTVSAGREGDAQPADVLESRYLLPDQAEALAEHIAATGPVPGEKPGMTHIRALPLALSSGALYPHVATEDVPAVAARHGVTTVELMLQTASEYDPAFIEQVKRNANAAGVDIHAVHPMHTLHPMLDSYPRRAAEARALFSAAIAATRELGGRVVVWHGPSREAVASDADWERFLALTRDLAEECRTAGVTLGIENVSWCALSQVRHVTQLAKELENIGDPASVGFVFDPFQAAEAGANPFMMLAAMGNRVVDVHLSDYRESDAVARHLPPGEGDLPWSALIRAIAGSGYSGPLMIESPIGADGSGMERVRDHLDPLVHAVLPFDPDSPSEESTRTLPAGVLEGIALFNDRRFYEQHEVIEHEWHAERAPVRQLYQGILQIGVGFHHALSGNHRGAVLLLSSGIEKVAEFQPEHLGVDTAGLVAASQRCLDELIAKGPARLEEFDIEQIPTISVATA